MREMAVWPPGAGTPARSLSAQNYGEFRPELVTRQAFGSHRSAYALWSGRKHIIFCCHTKSPSVPPSPAWGLGEVTISVVGLEAQTAQNPRDRPYP